jgi:hypothetical protein
MAFVAAPLSKADAALLRRLEVPRSRQWLAAAMISGAGFISLVLVLTNTTLPVCTPTSPCGPDPGAKVIYTLMGAVVALAFVQRRLAATIAVAAAAALLYYNHLHPAQAPKGFATVIVVVVAVWSLAWAEWTRTRPAPKGWKPEPRPVPAPRIPIPVKPIGALVGLALIAVGIAAAFYGPVRQAAVDAQMRDAQLVQVRVIGKPSTFVIRVAYPPGSATDITVKSTRAYPFGRDTLIAVDDHGLRQPVAEPYDASFFWVYAFGFGLAGLGLAWFSLERVLPRWRLQRRPQPATAVYVRRRSGEVLLFAGDATVADLPFAELPVRDELMREFTPSLLVTAEPAPSLPKGTNPQMLPPEPAVLYGTPIPGRWCTVTVGELTLSPKGPLRTTQDMLPFGSIAEGATVPAHADRAATEVAPADGERALTAEERARIRPEDATATPDQVLYHRLSRLLAYGLILVGLVLAAWAAGLAGPAAGWPRVVVVAAVLGIANYAGWRLWLRPLVAWSGGGIAIRPSWRRPTALAWSSVTGVGRVGGQVWLDRAHRGVMPAAPWQTRWGAGRRPEQLMLALRQARLRSRSDLPVPRATGPGDVRDAILLWLVQAAATAAVAVLLARPA